MNGKDKELFQRIAKATVKRVRESEPAVTGAEASWAGLLKKMPDTVRLRFLDLPGSDDTVKIGE